MGTGKTPTLGIAYCESKQGKTTDMLYSFPGALWIAAPGALNPSEGVCGYAVPASHIIDADHIPHVTGLLLRLKQGLIETVAIDDLSLLADRTVRHFEREKHLGGYELWGAVRNAFLELRETARRVGVHVVMNAHEQAPKMVLNTRVRGGPLLPGKATADIPKACDWVYRGQSVLRIDKPIGWPVVYRCTPEDPDYVSGDRNHVTPDKSPMNLREILRLAGYTLRRLPEIAEWQEKMVEKAAGEFGKILADASACGALNDLIIDGCMSKYHAPEQHGIWTARDGYDRAVLRAALSGHRRHYYK